ncbi:MAG TPA: energy transducer TonB, partial [Cellvibrionaceae bacterium]|nr:energy transducer TonB [Cellvibrionaceae bacterium]
AAKAAALQAAMAVFAEQNTLASPISAQEQNIINRADEIANNIQAHKTRYSINSLAARFYGLFAVAGLHAAVIIALMVGLAPKNEMVLVDNVKVQTVEELKEEIALPPPPPPDYVPPPPDFIPPPSFNVAAEAPAPANAITSVAAKAEAAPAAKAPPTPARPPKKGLAPPSYPSESKKLGEEGAVALALYLNEEGKVQEARVETSSGFPRLDEAAVKHAVKAWKFEPCTEAGKPVACWYKIKFRFQLKDA